LPDWRKGERGRVKGTNRHQKFEMTAGDVAFAWQRNEEGEKWKVKGVPVMK